MPFWTNLCGHDKQTLMSQIGRLNAKEKKDRQTDDLIVDDLSGEND